MKNKAIIVQKRDIGSLEKYYRETDKEVDKNDTAGSPK